MNDPRYALVTGATGVLGPGLVATLLSEGWRVRILSRSAYPARVPPEVEVLVGDVTDATAVASAVDGVSTVFHLAGVLHNPKPAASDQPRYEAVNVDGARHVARAAAIHGARVIAFSTIAVYGATPRPADESTAVRPVGLYATTKARGEDALLNSAASVRVMRLAAVYGPRMKGNYQRLAEALRRGRFVPVGDGSNRRTLVHESDALRAAILAALGSENGSRVYNVTDGKTHSMREILGAMCAALGRREPRVRIPATVAQFLARGIGQGHVVEKYLENVEVKGELIQRDLGFVPSFDIQHGWRDALHIAGKARP